MTLKRPWAPRPCVLPGIRPSDRLPAYPGPPQSGGRGGPHDHTQEGTVDDLRSPDLRPQARRRSRVEEAFAKALPHREKYSKLAAFFPHRNRPVEPGYPHLALREPDERNEVRAEAGKDPNWPPDSQGTILHMESEIFQPAPFMRPMGGGQKLGNVYEMRIYEYQNGAMPKVLDIWGGHRTSGKVLAAGRRYVQRHRRLNSGSTSGPTRTWESATASAPKRPPPRTGRRRRVSFWSTRPPRSGAGQLLAASVARHSPGDFGRGEWSFAPALQSKQVLIPPPSNPRRLSMNIGIAMFVTPIVHRCGGTGASL